MNTLKPEEKAAVGCTVVGCVPVIIILTLVGFFILIAAVMPR